MISQNQRLGIVYVPTGSKAPKAIPYGLNGCFSLWIEHAFNRLAHQLGEMLQSPQIMGIGVGVCSFVPLSGSMPFGERKSVCGSVNVSAQETSYGQSRVSIELVLLTMGRCQPIYIPQQLLNCRLQSPVQNAASCQDISG
jgi:hypothetical protein